MNDVTNAVASTTNRCRPCVCELGNQTVAFQWRVNPSNVAKSKKKTQECEGHLEGVNGRVVDQQGVNCCCH